MDNLELQTEINHLMKQALGTDAQAIHARNRARKLLGLDELNWNYFFYLYQGKVGGSQAKPIRIYEQGKQFEGKWIAYPLAVAPKELTLHLRSVKYSDLKFSPERYDETAKNVALWVKKMQAGSGSSMARTSYLSRRLGIPENEVKIGAKGTDLFVDVANPREGSGTVSIPLAEAQIIQSMRQLENGEVGEVIFHDIVSSETENSLRKLWAKPSLYDRSMSYNELIKRTPGLSHFGESYQAFLPTLDESGSISFKRKAPGGHALFAVDAIRAAYIEELRPKTQRPLVAAISNGEDLSGTPDRFMLGYLVKNKIPIALVTTERTAVDMKGGLISLLQDEKGNVSLTVVETAQAKEAGQEKLFANLQGAVNTNLALFNYDALVPLISQEVQEIGEDEFLKIISPDLISNVKEQKDADGISRKYLQLEGAMGSTLMNLDRYWRKKYGQALVHLINVERKYRTEFFSPIKAAFDFFMQFHSDRFVFDATQMRLRNMRPGELPQISLQDPTTKDKFYQDVDNVLEAFKGASIKDLDKLTIIGQVALRGIVLRGNVEIINHADHQVSLNSLLAPRNGATVLENTVVELDADGRLKRKSA